MNKETKFLISLLGDYANNRKTEPIEDLNWQDVLNYARSQNINGIVYRQCKDFIPADFNGRFSRLYMAEIYAYGNRINITRQIEKAFKEKDIPYFLVKGPVVAEYYTDPPLRTMGDSDFVVKEEIREEAYKVMDELGYECRVSTNERQYYRNNMEVEIHYSLFYEENFSETEQAYAARMWDYVKDNRLDTSYHFVYLLLHLKKHIMYNGVGFRQFLDLAFMMKKEKLNWDFIKEEMNKMGLTKYLYSCLYIVREYFDTDIPIEIEEMPSEFKDTVAEKLIADGVHGHDNEENADNEAFQHISHEKSSRFRFVFHMFFPPYKEMVSDVNYAFLKKYPWLLPFAWIYRFFLSVKKNKAVYQLKRSIQGLFLSKEKIDSKKNYMDQWGL